MFTLLHEADKREKLCYHVHDVRYKCDVYALRSSDVQFRAEKSRRYNG